MGVVIWLGIVALVAGVGLLTLFVDGVLDLVREKRDDR